MNENNGNRVVVGVDGTNDSLRAVRFAVAAAKAIDAELVLVHAAPARLPVGPVRSTVMGEFDEFSHSIVHDAAVLAQAIQPDLTVRTRVIHGPVVRSVVAAGAQAALIVLGSSHDHDMAHLWTGRILGGVAARATCPTVVVPPEWRPDEIRGRVLVGFKSPGESTDVLAAGFAEAARRRAELVIVHGWKLPSVYDDIISARVAEEAVRLQTEETIEHAIASLRAAEPGVPVSVRVQHADRVRALVSASHEADVMILTTRLPRHGFPHLGGTARALLRWSACPVMAVPVARVVETEPDAAAAGRHLLAAPSTGSGGPG